MHRTAFAAAAILVAGLAGGYAAEKVNLDDPISVRQHIMGNVGGSMKLLGAMAKGEDAYDPRVAQVAFRTMNAASLGFGSQFPVGSEQGGKTEAAPKIWQDMAGFRATLAKFEADTAAAIETPMPDLDSFKPVFGKVAGNCKSCHETYRIKKN